MKKFFSLILFFLIASCGEYTENKITLDQTQEDAIEDFMTQQCITDNATLFNQLAARTVDFTNADLDQNLYYQFQTTNKSPKKFVILKRNATEMYIYVETTDPEVKDKVYKYTTTDNANHIDKIKT